ncbi:MAG: hypothetical protein AAFN41_10150 [Planctomycetota bacterium]
MAFKAHAGEQYTIRQKILKIFGAAFHIYDAEGEVIGYCKQKAFRFREKLILYTDESQNESLLTIEARTILDFGTTYDVDDGDGTRLGSVRRKGLKSMLRDEWAVLDPGESEVATLKEDSMGKALIRRFAEPVAVFMPQKFEVTHADGRHLAVFRTHFNPFVYRLGIAINQDSELPVDEMMLLATAFLIAAIEGRQSSEGSGSGLFSGE